MREMSTARPCSRLIGEVVTIVCGGQSSGVRREFSERRREVIAAEQVCCQQVNEGRGGHAIVNASHRSVIDPTREVLASTTSDVPFVAVDIDLAATATARTSYPGYVLNHPREGKRTRREAHSNEGHYDE